MIMQGKEYDPSSVEGLDDLPYAIPSLVIESHQVDVNAPVQWLRSVGHSHTAFAAECFSDELAAWDKKIPTSCGASCWSSSRGIWVCSTLRPRRRGGASPCRMAPAGRVRRLPIRLT